MPHLHSFSAANFRVFAKEQSFNFKPITILTGTNSAGKSSLIRALTLLGNSIKEGAQLDSLDFGKMPHLGDFATVLNDLDANQSPFIKFILPIHLNYLEGDFHLEVWYSREPNGLKRDGKLMYFRIFKEEAGNCVNLVLFSLLPKDATISKGSISNNADSTASSGIEGNAEAYVYSIKVDIPLLKSELLKKIEGDKQDQASLAQEQPLIDDLDFSLEVDESWFMQPFRNNFYDFTQRRDFHIQSERKESLMPRDLAGLEDGIEHSIFESVFNTKNIKRDSQSKKKHKDKAIIRMEADTDNLSPQWIAAENKAISRLADGLTLNLKPGKIDHIDLWIGDGWLVENLGEAISKTLEGLFKDMLKDIRGTLGALLVKKTPLGELLLDKLLIDNISNGLALLRQQFDRISIGSNRGDQRRYLSGDFDDRGLHGLAEQMLQSKAMDIQVIREFLNYWINQFGFGDKLSVELSNASLTKTLILHRKGKQVNLADLGFGVSQLIPILLNFAIASARNVTYLDGNPLFKASILTIEEPEANLHPALQSKLADLLIDAAYKFNFQFIVETHSEYLVRKLQYWTAMQVIGPEAVNIYYFYDPENIPLGEPQVKEITIDDNGKLSDDFGTGFFDEADRIAISIWNRTQASNN